MVTITLQHGCVRGGGVQGGGFGSGSLLRADCLFSAQLGYWAQLFAGKYPFYCILGQFLAL